MTQKKIDRMSSFEDTASVLKFSDRPSYLDICFEIRYCLNGNHSTSPDMYWDNLKWLKLKYHNRVKFRIMYSSKHMKIFVDNLKVL